MNVSLARGEEGRALEWLRQAAEAKEPYEGYQLVHSHRINLFRSRSGPAGVCRTPRETRFHGPLSRALLFTELRRGNVFRQARIAPRWAASTKR